MLEINRHKRYTNIFLNYLMCTMILYFLYHVFAGKYGIISFIVSHDTLVKKQKIVQNIEKNISFRRNKIDKMKGDYVDADILDEEIRSKFGYAKKNEIVIYSRELEKNSLE